MPTVPGPTADERFRILDLLGRYIFAVDTGDIEAVLACFAPQAWVRYEGGAVYSGCEELRRFAEKVAGPDTAGRMHLNFPLFFAQEGPVVVVHSYLSIAQWCPPAPPTSFETLRYVRDHCVRCDDGAWRILGRHIANWNRDTRAAFRPGAGTCPSA
jgi:hypothetical protein